MLRVHLSVGSDLNPLDDETIKALGCLEREGSKMQVLSRLLLNELD
jgi:hypothetical protein